MGKFCTNCGAALNESMAFCFNCGTPTVPSESPAPAATEAPTPISTVAPSAPQFIPAQQAAPAKKSINKKALTIGGALVIAVVAVVVILIAVLGGKNTTIDSPEAALANYMALMHGDASRIASIAPDGFWEYRVQNKNTSKEEYIERCAQRIIDYPFDISAIILEKNDPPIETESNIRHVMAKFVDDEDSIQDIKQLVIEMTANGTTNTVSNYFAVKISNNWYIYDGYLGTFGLINI